VTFAADSSLEGDGFELLVPRHKSRGFPQHSGHCGGSAGAAALARAKESTAALIAILEGEPGRFAELAVAHSACPSKEAGGSLGQITGADVAPELATFPGGARRGAALPGAITDRHGFHVLRLDRRAPAVELPFEAVRERIADYLSEAVWRRALSQYIGILVVPISPGSTWEGGRRRSCSR
jgi:peptidyl-prolyl cis-trans isomerase C